MVTFDLEMVYYKEHFIDKSEELSILNITSSYEYKLNKISRA